MPKKTMDGVAQDANIESPEAKAEEAVAETFGEESPILTDENGVVLDNQSIISNPQYASKEEIAALPKATVTITKETREDRRTGIKRFIYTARLVLDRITCNTINLNEAEYGLIVAESGKEYFGLQTNIDAPVRFVKTVFENGNSTIRLDLFLSESVRIAQILDPHSAFYKLYLNRVNSHALPQFEPIVRYAKKA